MSRMWPAAEAALSRRFGALEIAVTRHAGDGRGLAAQFARQGVDLIVAAGGDGTASEVADGILTAAPDCRAIPDLSLLPVGTGSDLGRSLGFAGDMDRLAEAIATRAPRPLDAAMVTFRLDDGGEERRHFINIASLGISADIARAVNAASKRFLTGKMLFAWHTLRQLVRYRGAGLKVRVDGEEIFAGTMAVVAVANNHSFAGGMMIAPDARTDDGWLDVTIVRDAPRFTLIRALRLVYDGSHRTLDLCSFHRGREIVIEDSGSPIGLEIDGETAGSTPVSIRILPRALRLRG